MMKVKLLKSLLLNCISVTYIIEKNSDKSLISKLAKGVKIDQDDILISLDAMNKFLK